MRRLRSFLPLLALPAAASLMACGGKGDGRGDTIAVPAAAVDTTPNTSQAGGGAAVTAGQPGAGTAASGASAATGVDTPITRKIRAEDSAKQAAGAAKRP